MGSSSDSIAAAFRSYPHVGALLPATGYGPQQLKHLETTINRTDCDAVLVATPIDLSRIIDISRPSTRAFYELEEIGSPNLDEVVSGFVKAHRK